MPMAERLKCVVCSTIDSRRSSKHTHRHNTLHSAHIATLLDTVIYLLVCSTFGRVEPWNACHTCYLPYAKLRFDGNGWLHFLLLYFLFFFPYAFASVLLLCELAGSTWRSIWCWWFRWSWWSLLSWQCKNINKNKNKTKHMKRVPVPKAICYTFVVCIYQVREKRKYETAV